MFNNHPKFVINISVPENGIKFYVTRMCTEKATAACWTISSCHQTALLKCIAVPTRSGYFMFCWLCISA